MEVAGENKLAHENSKKMLPMFKCLKSIAVDNEMMRCN